MLYVLSIKIFSWLKLLIIFNNTLGILKKGKYVAQACVILRCY